MKSTILQISIISLLVVFFSSCQTSSTNSTYDLDAYDLRGKVKSVEYILYDLKSSNGETEKGSRRTSLGSFHCYNVGIAVSSYKGAFLPSFNLGLYDMKMSFNRDGKLIEMDLSNGHSFDRKHKLIFEYTEFDSISSILHYSYGDLCSKMEAFYDESGFKEKEVIYDDLKYLDSLPTIERHFSYNSNGQITSLTVYGPDTVLFKEEYKYNDKNKIRERKVTYLSTTEATYSMYYRKGKLSQVTSKYIRDDYKRYEIHLYKYDSKNRPIWNITFNTDENDEEQYDFDEIFNEDSPNHGYHKMKYNNHNNLIEFEINEGHYQRWEYDYSYDGHDNWVEWTIKGDDAYDRIVERKIEYFEK